MKLVVRVRESSVWVAWPFSVAGALAECSHQGGLGRGELCPTTRGGGEIKPYKYQLVFGKRGEGCFRQGMTDRKVLVWSAI